ncbi:MAG: S-layer homology domain-containing protein [Anaerotignum sp.]|nr:S-layer homology domain-containing protein [Anaerotignum sp.]
MKKLITFVTAASLLAGSMCTTAYAVTFADINTVTWSGFVPFIEEAAELGLMSGYDENGKKYCKPRNNVTYCEAAQLMYSIMRVYSGQDVSDATVTKWKPVMSAYNIPDWAYKATAYSLDNNILSTTDLTKLQGNAQKINTKAATREDVGVIFGKALDTISGYDTKSNASLSYKDKAQVSAAAVPYLELLYRADLMVGDTDNNFSPKANISRAEMAVLSVKTYNKLTETAPPAPQGSIAVGTVSGRQIMANGDLFLSLTINTGGGLSLFAAEDKVVPRYNGDKIAFEDIGTGDTVKVTYAGTDITALEVIYSKNGIRQTTEETYELVDLTSSKVTVLDGSKEVEYRLDKKVDVELEGKSSSISKLQDAMEDADYDVTLTMDADEYVLKMKAMLNAKNPTEGYVYDLDDDKITITAGSKEYTYPLASDVVVEYDGKEMRFSKFEDDYDEYNYLVKLELDKNYEVDEITVESLENEYNGTLTFINSNRIEFTAGRDTHNYSLASDVTVKIDGKKSSVSALRSDLQDGKAYTVTVELDRYDDVTDIIATPKYGSNNDGKLKDIDSYEIKITVGDKEYTYDLNSNVDVTINGRNRDVEDLENYLGEYAFDVALEFDGDGDVSKINATLTEANAGELKDIVESTDTLTISAAGLTIDLELASGVDITLDGDDISLTELNDELDYAFGDERIYVELEYNKNGKVDKIDAYWENIVGELREVDRDKDTIDVKVGSSTKTYDVASDVEIVYTISSAVDTDKYGKASDYASSLRGLRTFLGDCDDANDDCEVALTVDDDEVIRIRAVAK